VTRRLGKLLLEIGLPIAIVTFWWFASADSTNPYYPPLSKIWQSVQDNWVHGGHFRSDLVPTIRRVAIGYTGAVVIGVTAGIALGSLPTLRRAFEPVLELIRATPGIAIIPISMLIFGIGDSQKAFVITFVCVWPILLNTTEGVRGIDRSFYDAASIYAFRGRDRLLRVTLPGASPQMFAGLRIALAQALLVCVVAELFASTSGVGYFINYTQQTFRVTDMWSGIIVLAIAAYLVNLLFISVETRVLYWHRGWRASELGEPVDSGKKRGSLHRGIFRRGIMKESLTGRTPRRST
jgi:sulfonate transport system permease protein